jgi:chemotaxis protein histidine kinase CheA
MSETGNDVQAKLARLKEKFARGLPEKVSQIEAGFAQLFAGPWQEESCSTAYRQIHSLVGSSGTYTFAEISGVARAAEAILKQALETRSMPPASRRTELDGLVAKLRELAADAARQVPS